MAEVSSKEAGISFVLLGIDNEDILWWHTGVGQFPWLLLVVDVSNQSELINSARLQCLLAMFHAQRCQVDVDLRDTVLARPIFH